MTSRFIWDVGDIEIEKPHVIVKKGGEGSGDFGHAGRPGEVGGSSSHSVHVDRKKKIKIETELREFENAEVIYDAPMEMAKIVDPEGNVVLEKKGDGVSVSFSDAEVSKMKDCILTHNHPTDYTFSRQDLSAAKYMDLQEMRATCKSGTYIMRRPKNGWDSVDKSTVEDIIREEAYKDMDYRKSQGMEAWITDTGVIMNNTWKRWCKDNNVEYIYVPRR